MPPRIKKLSAPPEVSKSGIARAKLKEEGRMVFSFLYFSHPHDIFRLEDCGANYLQKLTERLKELSRYKPSEVKAQQSRTLHFDRIRWEGTPVPSFGIPNESDITGDEAWEFGITRNEHGRVHGFFIDPTFYIVWLDPAHKLCP